MDELIQQAPNAHEHLAAVQDPVLREMLESEVSRLSHIALTQENDSFMVTRLVHIEADKLSPEQAEIQMSTERLASEAARLTAVAASRFEATRPSDDPAYRPHPIYVFQEAK